MPNGEFKDRLEKKALKRFEQIAEWYALEMGNGAAMKFAKGIYNTVSTLSYSPGIGTLDKEFSTSRNKYYSFLSHPKYRIIYRFTKTTLYITSIRSTQMKQDN